MDLKNNITRFIEKLYPTPKYGLYYWRPDHGQGNLGDELAPYLVEKITGAKPLIADRKHRYKLVTVGSLIESRTVLTGGVFWGTGTHNKDVASGGDPRFLSFRAVRGPLTRASLMDAGYINARPFTAIQPCCCRVFIRQNRKRNTSWDASRISCTMIRSHAAKASKN